MPRKRKPSTAPAAAEASPDSPQPLVHTHGDAAEPARAADTEFRPADSAATTQPSGPAYTGTRVSLPDGTVAHYRDYGNRGGVVVRFDLPEGVDKPAPGVTEPLKERHEGRAPFRYKGQGDWHKAVDRNPVAERLDAEARFAEAVERQRAATDPHGPGRG